MRFSIRATSAGLACAAGLALAGPALAGPAAAADDITVFDLLDGSATVGRGDKGDAVVQIQSILNGFGITTPETGVFDAATVKSVENFQEKFNRIPTGRVNGKTYDFMLLVRAKTSLPERCLTESLIICVDRNLRIVRMYRKGELLVSTDARFGAPGMATREGVYQIYSKVRYLISDLTGTAMPYSMFYSGGQALHYSALFKRDGYSGASHGCVNIRSMKDVKKIYRLAPVGTKVYIYH